MRYSEVKAILKQLHQDGWSKFPKWGAYSKIWSRGEHHFKYEIFFDELQFHTKNMTLEEVLSRIEKEAQYKLDEHIIKMWKKAGFQNE